MGGGHQARGHVEHCCPGPGFGVGMTWRDIFPGDIIVLSHRADRGLCRCRGCQWGPLGFSVDASRYLITLLRAKDHVGAAWVWA
jgi:hypothetical protein